MEPNSREVRVLIVEDSPDDAELVLLALRQAGFKPIWQRVETESEMRAALAEPWDIVLSDFSLPTFNARGALATLRQHGTDLPFIVVSGTIGEELAVQTMRAGATDYVLKQNLVRLGPAIARELREAENRRAGRQAEQVARQLAAIVQSSADAIVSTDLDGVVTSWNPAAERLYGWSAAEAVGRHISLIVPADRRPELDDFLTRLRRGESVDYTDTIRVTKSGQRVHVSLTLSPVRDVAGALVGSSSIARDTTERIRWEEDRQRAAERVQRDAWLLANVRDSVIVTDLEGVVTYWNEGATRLFGWAAEERVGRPLLDRVPAGARVEAAAMWHRVVAGDEFSGPFEDYRKDGSRVWVDIRVRPITETGGRVVGIIGIANDIGDRRRAEDERDSALRLLRLQFERMPLAAMLLDAELLIIDWNPAAERIFGFTKAEVLDIGSPFACIVPADAVAQTSAIFDRLRAGDMTAHSVNNNLTKDGRTLICEWFNTPLFDEEGGFLGALALGQDITLRRIEEEELLLRDRAIQAVTQGILITDHQRPDNPIVYASPGFLRLTGYRAEQVIGRNCRFLQCPDTDPSVRAEVKAAVEQGRSCTVELLNCRHDGSSFWNELSVSPVIDSEGHLTHFVGVQTDVTQRRQLEEQYRQAQKMEAVGQLAGGIAHDFNNVATIINGYTALLLDRIATDVPAREWLNEIKEAGERAAALTRQLLAFSRRQLVAPQVLNLNALIAGLQKMLQRIIGEDVHLRTLLDSDLGAIKADPGQLEQVIVNLAVNARDAMPQGGSLTISTSNFEADAAFVRSTGAVAARYALLSVADSGSGMTPEVMARAFEPFFTSKEVGKGTGLGLAVVHGIVQQSGGLIELDSRPLGGTTLRIYLPRVEELVHASPPALTLESPPGGIETVLLAEDEDSVRRLVSRVLGGAGYRVLEAGDGESALRLAASYQGTIQLLVTDVVMRGGGGLELATRLLESRPEVAVLYLSGHTDDAVICHGILHKDVSFLQKPFTAHALCLKVREVLDRAAFLLVT
jgi:two-component system cell cycle sensor histidine kinase/response regulator CckA